MSMDRRRFISLSAAIAAAPLAASCSGYDKVAAPGVPRSDFDEDSTALQVTEGIDLSGKIAVVTGCTSGIGFETMRVLALRGAWVIGTSRSLQRADDACKLVRGKTTPLALELSDFDSVVRCAETIRALNSPIDMLILNAGYRGGGNERTLIDGVEKHFLVNHLGHFVLVNRLLDRLFFAWQGRIVVVASRAAYRGAPETGIRFDDITLERDYSDSLAYGHSKLANVLFSLELGKLLKGTRITSNALHPGLIDTEIDRNVNRFLQLGFGVLAALRGKSVDAGAATSCFVATSPLLGSTSGRYFEDCNAIEVRESHLQDMAMADRLWVVSEQLTRDYLVKHERPDWDEFENGLRKSGRDGA
ncbi:MAG: SDR family NAD(P)-dependent oxidoreductase [Gammaproteobacteria bacterium]|jgi:NAD(P)-dependent dehydrogenase (short-subunit alcohol dehydrogenase family)|nr:SDR family NAD(P)-dependent oxidoreductase [Gammaproteobacteria bacterium]MDH3758081.1 SDR family NAD(P)-dependent oxidoreductase [Gammaproteobacteria bacterium]MDH3848066.1 SDR family NAD(P)-dependent oxidoreductase [Gammaproteobacteria bacterium]MDH3863726.1 SDR family NAD(P)-dependent oxidoreductase [Gammaproteobacteria bacterium]MDH3904346.1 SDR family NAD(P)-dependent oxidoreductase [Gammaproteobacteria bacterium]